jgi:hypothetical protein
MESPLFELTNCADLLNKAKHDLAALEKQVNSYDLFNCLCTVNHLKDWVRQDPQTVGIRDEAKRLGENPKVLTIENLCNHAKHFGRSREPRYQVKTEMLSGYNSGRYGMGPYGIGEPTYEVDLSGEMVNVLDLLRDVIGEWEKLLKRVV